MGQTEDKLEILELISRYSHAADGKDPQAYADVFTEDGVFVGNISIPGMPKPLIIRGRDQLLQLAKRNIESAEQSQSQTRHFKASTIFLELTAERALTRSYLLVTVAEPKKPPTPAMTGVYEDEIVRTPQGWRFKKIEFILDNRPRQPFEG